MDDNNLQYEEFCDYSEDSSVDTQFILTIDDKYAGFRLDAALADILPEFSRSRIANAIRDGNVLVNGVVKPNKTRLLGGETVHLTLPETAEASAFVPQDIPLNIVYEDDDVLVINKPKQLVVHPAAGNWSGTLLNGLLFHRSQLSGIPRAGIVHRLDKDTTGLMVVAKTIAAQTNLVRQLQMRTVKRVYRAIVNGIVPYDGKIETLIGRDPHNRTKMAVVKFGGKEAITHVTVLERFDSHCYIECALETGRTHQIRVHMKEAGHPLAGDALYGNIRHPCSDEVKNAILSLGRQALHAHKLTFIHPANNQEISFNAAIPDDMKKVLSALRGKLNDESNHYEFSGRLDEDWEDEYDDEDEDDNDVDVIYVR